MDVRSGFVAVDEGELFYERVGEGFPVVLIHGALWDRRIWDPQIQAFAAQHDVVRFDARGHGRSAPPSRSYSEVDDVRRLLEGLGIPRCTLVGSSTGSQLALDVALAHPEVVDSAVLASPLVSGREWEDHGIEVLAKEIRTAIEGGDVHQAMAVELAVWTPLRTDPATDAMIRDVAMDNADIYRIDPGLAEPPEPALPRLDSIQAATLVVVGDHDVEEVHAIADLLVDRVPGAHKRVVAGADQLVNVRRPERFNKMVLEFLAFRSLA